MQYSLPFSFHQRICLYMTIFIHCRIRDFSETSRMLIAKFSSGTRSHAQSTEGYQLLNIPFLKIIIHQNNFICNTIKSRDSHKQQQHLSIKASKVRVYIIRRHTRVSSKKPMNKTQTTAVLLIFVVPYIFRNQLAKATSLGLQKGFVWILMFCSTTCFPAAPSCNLQLWGQQSASFVLEYQLVPINQCFIFYLGKLHGFTKMLLCTFVFLL